MTDDWPELLPTQRIILNRVSAKPGITQREIGLSLDVPQQTLSRQITDLLDAGLLQGGERLSSGKRGHPSLSLTLGTERIFSLGVSIMADAVSMILVDMAGTERGYLQRRPADTRCDTVLDTVAQGFRELTEAAGIAADRVPGIGVAITGVRRKDHRTFNPPRQLEDWNDVDVAKLFSERFGRTAWADNDGNAAAVGESLVGIGRWAPTFAYLYIATGFGGGAMVNGALARGRHGNVGEYGAMLQPALYPSPTLELLRQTMALRGQEFPNVSALIENFDVNMPGVDEWLGKVSDSLSFVCAACIAILDPDAIVLGGRIPASLAERLIERIALPENPRRGEARESVPIVPAAAQGDATALGAAVLPLYSKVFGSGAIQF